MSTIGTLLPRIEEYCRAAGMAESTFGRIAVNDGKLVSRLRAGGSITLRTFERIEAVLAAIHTIESATDRTVGSRIRLRRRQLGLSQDSVAAMLGIGPERLQEFEGGTTRVGAARLCAIAHALDAPISYFFASLPMSMNGRPDAAPAPLSAPGAAELLSAYARIENSPLRRAVLAVALHLAHGAPGSGSRSRGNTGAMRPYRSKSHAR